MPFPQFAVRTGVLPEEDRYAAQAPIGDCAIPRLRHTGYRAFGPFPKMPRCVPDRSLSLCTPLFAPPVKQVPRHGISPSQDFTGLPEFPITGGYHLHPADYWAWPALKAPHNTRVAAEAAAESPIEGGNPRRFGPGRAGTTPRKPSGLQRHSQSADDLPRTGA